MADENISMFVAVTEASPEVAQQFLEMSGGDVETAVDLYMNNADLRTQIAGAAQTEPSAGTSNRDNPITIDDDEIDDDDLQETGSRQIGGGSVPSMEDDEAMARRLQEEMYGGGGAGGAGAGGMADPEGIRAPMARTTETLVGPGSDWRDDPGEMQAAIAQQMAARQQRRARPGIFNQQETPSIWSQDDPTNPEVHRQVLSRATGGASDQSSKSNLLADLFRPPYEIIRQDLSWSAARDEGKELEKWLLVNVQDPSIFDCQVLNRDIWKNKQVQETIKENFIFLQYNKTDPRGQEYVNYYFNNLRDHEDAYPHIAIVDPRTGEQVKTWSGTPAPKANEFLMDLHEFLDRYSLRMDQKNPVQAKRKEKRKDVAEMSEEEMLQMAMQNSMENGSSAGPREEDPDSLTKGDKGKAPAAATAEPDVMDSEPTGTDDEPSSSQTTSPFASISSTNPHTEPTSTNAAETTRIQFRYSGGRIIRRFDLTDPVRRIYEWLKAAPFEGKEGSSFELIASGKNLIDMLETPIADAGLKNGTVMVEFTED